MSRVRAIVIPGSALFGLAVASVAVLFFEGIGHAALDDNRIAVPHAACVGKSLNAEGPYASLDLTCGDKNANTKDPLTIKRYAARPTVKFSCDIHRSGSADCK